MKPTELAYIAGIVEADGSIGINRWKKSYRLVVQVGMRNPAIPGWLKSKMGGTLTTTTKDNKPYHKWMVTGPKAKELCSNILPYLVEKRGQARTILIFPVNKRGEKFTEGGNDLRNILWQIARELNH